MQYTIDWKTVKGERYVKVADVVSILLEIEEESDCDHAAMFAWTLAQVLGCFLAEKPGEAYRQLTS